MNKHSLLMGIVITLFISLMFSPGTRSQDLNDFRLTGKTLPQRSTIVNHRQFNGYTNHWQDNYTQWHRYGNLFKMAVSDVQKNLMQSKLDIARDMGLPGLLMQEGFFSHLFSAEAETLSNPSPGEVNQRLGKGNLLVITSPSSELGETLEEKANELFLWADELNSYQLDAKNIRKIKAFFLENNGKYLFVISSESNQASDQFRKLLDNAREITDNYALHKGLFGASSLLKSVTCASGHPLDIIGAGMNEGNSWFIFDGYMDFLARDELKQWMQDVNLPVYADVGFSPVYGCENYQGLQVQDMASPQAWIDFAREKGGYAFRPVYAPQNDEFEFDGYITHEGNKEQIDQENVPFIHKTGYLSDNLTSSMVLFIDKNTPLTRETLWNAILNRQEVAVMENARLMGPAKYRHALGLLYLDKTYLEEYFSDFLDMEAKMEGYDLLVTLRNYSESVLTGSLDVTPSPYMQLSGSEPGSVTLQPYETKEIRIPLQPQKEAMGYTNPVAVNFKWGKHKKSTLTMLDLPPALSMHQLLYGHAPQIEFPVTLHNFTGKTSFPVEITVFHKNNLNQAVLKQSKTCKISKASFSEINFSLPLEAGNYLVRAEALGLSSESQLGVGKAEGKPYVYEMDLNSDGINEYRMENDSVQITLLRTGARIIEYIVKSKNDNVLFKIWPEKSKNHKSPFRKRRFYPYGGFEDFLGQASMETHKIYDAEIVRGEGDFVRVSMTADYYGNQLKKTFTLYGNSPLVEVRFELTFKNPEANVLGPQPILTLGESHGTEDVFYAPAMEGLKTYRMRPEEYYGMAIDVKEGWNAGYDTKEDISFVGAFPVSQPLFLHMWMNHPDNTDAPHYYVEFQPWTPIIQKSKMYFSYYLWGSGGAWENSLDALKERNLITIRK